MKRASPIMDGVYLLRGTWVVDPATGKLVDKLQYLREQARTARRSPLASPQVMRDIEPFRNVAVDGKIVGSRSEKREMMKRHNLTEMGNEKRLTKRNPKKTPHIRESLKRSIQELSSR